MTLYRVEHHPNKRDRLQCHRNDRLEDFKNFRLQLHLQNVIVFDDIIDVTTPTSQSSTWVLHPTTTLKLSIFFNIAEMIVFLIVVNFAPKFTPSFIIAKSIVYLTIVFYQIYSISLLAGLSIYYS